MNADVTSDVHIGCRAEVERLKAVVDEAMAQNERFDKRYGDAGAEVERLRASIDEILASLDEYETHHRHAYTMKCIRRVIARLAIPAY